MPDRLLLVKECLNVVCASVFWHGDVLFYDVRGKTGIPVTTWTVDIWTQLAAEGAVKKRSEEVLGLPQCLSLHGTQSVHSLNQNCELLLKSERWKRESHLTESIRPQVRHIGSFGAQFCKLAGV